MINCSPGTPTAGAALSRLPGSDCPDASRALPAVASHGCGTTGRTRTSGPELDTQELCGSERTLRKSAQTFAQS